MTFQIQMEFKRMITLWARSEEDFVTYYNAMQKRAAEIVERIEVVEAHFDNLIIVHILRKDSLSLCKLRRCGRQNG